MVSYSKRAINPLQKAERRTVILQAALQLFERGTFDKLTMAEIGRAAGVAKGTLYLYFQSKEELFLQVLLELYRDWFAVFDDLRDGQSVVDLVVDSLAERPKLLELMSMAHAVVEANAPLPAVLAFKESLAESLGRLAEQTRISPQRLMWAHAAIVGLHSTTNPPPHVREAVKADPRLQTFDLDFDFELRRMLACLI